MTIVGSHLVGEAQNGPFALVRHLGQRAIRVDREGVSHREEHGNVGFGVGIGEGLTHVDIAVGGDRLHGDGLVLSDGVKLHLTSEFAVFVDHGA